MCGRKIQLRIRRDLWRKTVCSKECRHRQLRMINSNLSDDVNKKKGHPKENHSKWIKDRSKVKDKRMMTSPEGKIWRLAVFERDKFICQECKQRGGSLEAHHIKFFAEYIKLRFDVKNGITLCKRCHHIIHQTKPSHIQKNNR